jgi:hypothetical protein
MQLLEAINSVAGRRCCSSHRYGHTRVPRTVPLARDLAGFTPSPLFAIVQHQLGAGVRDGSLQGTGLRAPRRAEGQVIAWSL